jgi:hypothetical protein
MSLMKSIRILDIAVAIATAILNLLRSKSHDSNRPPSN